MSNSLQEAFRNSDFITTPEVARIAQISDAKARALAAELDVPRAGPAYVWGRKDVERLLEELDEDDADDDPIDTEESAAEDADDIEAEAEEGDTLACAACDADVDDDDDFCPDCGADLSDDEDGDD